jgi:ketosteroid isomerase-like protein
MTAAKTTPKELIERLFETFKSQDREVAEPLLASDFSFTSPYNDAIDKAAYFAECWPNAAHLQDLKIEHILIEGNAAFVSYQASTADGVTFRNTEFFTFADEQIASIEVYFGAVYHQGIFTRMR